jgi:hypothetical protein
MSHLPRDAEASRLVRSSAVFRAVRGALLALDASIASSAFRRVVTAHFTRRSIAVLLLTAGITHGVLEAVVPAGVPAGRYLFAVSAVVAAVLLMLPRSE